MSTRTTRPLRRVDAWHVLAVALVVGLVAATSPWGSPSPVPRALASSALALYVLPLAWRHRRSAVRGAQQHLAVLLIGFTGLAAVSMLWSAAPARTAGQTFALMLLVVIVVGSMVGRWHDEERVARDTTVIYAVLGAVVVASLVVFAAGVEASVAPPRDRLQGILENPNSLAMACALLLALLAGLSRSHPGWALGLAFPVAVTLLLTESRTGLAAAAIGIGVALARGRLARKRYALVVIVGVAVVITVVPLLGPDQLPGPVGRVAERFGSAGLGATRAGAWRQATDLWQERPLLGHGFRTGEALFRRERAAAGGEVPFGTLNTAHSGFLQVLMELGLVGLAVVAALMLVTLWPYRVAAVSPTLAGLHGAVAAGWALQVTESHLFGLGAIFATVFWLSVAMLLSLVACSRPTPRHAA